MNMTAKQSQGLIIETAYDRPMKGPKPPSSPHSTRPQGLVLSDNASHHTTDLEEALRLLLAANFHVEANDFDSAKALHWAARYGHEAVGRLLLEKGANIEARSCHASKRTALLEATANEHEAVVRLLLENGANITEKDEEGKTALHYAKTSGHKTVVRLLEDATPVQKSIWGY